MKTDLGGFFGIDQSLAASFTKHVLQEEDFNQLKISKKLSRKILLLAPGKRLSWEHYIRRTEIWLCIGRNIAVASSLTNEETDKRINKF